jgi:hypothetical protein
MSSWVGMYLKRRRGLANHVFAEKGPFEQVVLLAPRHEHLRAHGVVVDRQLGLAGPLAFDEVAVEVALAEVVKGNVVLLRPGSKAGELDLVIADGLWGVGGFLVEQELVEHLFPGCGCEISAHVLP